MKLSFQEAQCTIQWSAEETRQADWKAAPQDSGTSTGGGFLVIKLGSFDEARELIEAVERSRIYKAAKAAPRPAKAPRKPRTPKAASAPVVTPIAPQKAPEAVPEAPTVPVKVAEVPAPAPALSIVPAAAPAKVPEMTEGERLDREGEPDAQAVSAIISGVKEAHPAAALAAMTIKQVVVLLQDRGVKGRRLLVAVCEALRADVPKLAKIAQMDERVARVLEIVAAESGTLAAG
jgi:hypothetical protein